MTVMATEVPPGVQTKTRQLKKISLLPIALITVVLLPSLIWILNDRSVWPWDQALYGENSVDLWQHLVATGSWRKAMLNAFAVKAPGIAWIGQFFTPLRHITGTIESALLVSILVQQAITLFLVWDIVGRLFEKNRRLQIAALFICAAGPLFVGMTHQYFVEALQLLSIAYVYWIAVRSVSGPPLTTFSHLLTAGTLAMLAKITSPAYCAFPAAIAIWNGFALWRKCSTEKVSKWTWAHLSLGLILFISACVWYKRHLSAMLAFAKETSSGDIALLYGKKESLFKTLADWSRRAQSSVVLPDVLMVIGGVLLIAGFIRFLKFRTARDATQSSFNHPFVLYAAIGHVIVMFTIFACSINREVRYLLPLLPSMLIIFCFALHWAKSHQLTTVVLTAFAVQWVIVHIMALGLLEPGGKDWDSAESDNHSLAMRMTHWVKRIQPAGLKRAEVTQLIDLVCTPEFNNRIHLCGVSLPWLNADSLSFYAKAGSLESKTTALFTSFAFAESNPDNAWKHLKASNCGYFISRRNAHRGKNSDAFNAVSQPVLELVERDSTFVQQEFKSRQGILLFRNQSAAQLNAR